MPFTLIWCLYYKHLNMGPLEPLNIWNTVLAILNTLVCQFVPKFPLVSMIWYSYDMLILLNICKDYSVLVLHSLANTIQCNGKVNEIPRLSRKCQTHHKFLESSKQFDNFENIKLCATRDIHVNIIWFYFYLNISKSIKLFLWTSNVWILFSGKPVVNQ